MEKIIDLRSDTVTKPTTKMREAMMKAEVGDDVFGEDPTVNLLEEKSAQLLGKEAAIFVPTGTMGNQIAIKCHTEPGDEVILDYNSHIYNYELGAMSVISGTLPRVIFPEDTFFSEEEVLRAIRPEIYYLPKTSLLCLENTHNMNGGRVLSYEKSKSLCQLAKEKGLRTHLDGARIFNAAIALKIEPKKLAEPFDSVMFSLSKGLSCPVGSILCGSKDFIKKARKIRKMLGGGMRQAGVIAICGLVAFEEILPKLEEDHKKAKILAEAFSKNPIFEVELDNVETNIFMVKVKNNNAHQISLAFKEKNILMLPINDSTLRIVTHKDISFEDVEFVSDIIEKFKC